MSCDTVDLGHGHPELFLKTTLKMVHSKGCFNIFPEKQRGNKCITTKVAAGKYVYGQN